MGPYCGGEESVDQNEPADRFAEERDSAEADGRIDAAVAREKGLDQGGLVATVGADAVASVGKDTGSGAGVDRKI